MTTIDPVRLEPNHRRVRVFVDGALLLVERRAAIERDLVLRERDSDQARLARLANAAAALQRIVRSAWQVICMPAVYRCVRAAAIGGAAGLVLSDIAVLPAAQEHVLAQEDGRDRLAAGVGDVRVGEDVAAGALLADALPERLVLRRRRGREHVAADQLRRRHCFRLV
mgnify:CR=1 FL=1